ncbi:uncharacterized protein A4U43_C09F680 [Asparagus officinalis]|uniref:Glycosyl hydrolase family 32 N-terminal domain-containing protein n=1 Tax=Asparagus officinalis TaxID=4686 RepID=A0A5P1E492_ASPOF|nr:uncharacterized protein A4U43_C09F680 [Asparagus officinalis]
MASSLVPGLVWILVSFFFLPSAVDRRSCVEAARRSLLNSERADTNSIVSAQYRTAYHFQPLRNWINDPNGPVYYNGIYHLFYQYNPYAAIWGNITWGHSVSTDLVHWTGLEPALSPTDPFDVNGCWSGSATIPGGDAEKRQVQNFAYPKNLSDPLLREWIKPGYNPVMEPVDGLDPNQFRDPTTGWLGHDGLWRVAVGAEVGLKGQALLYRSKDFVRWARTDNPLFAANGSGTWECPDFYYLKGEGEKYVLKMSLGEADQSDHYMLGAYDEERDTFVPDDTEDDDYRMWRRYDYGKFYASKTFFDDKKQRRILWGWLNESDSAADDVAKGWSGIQTVPRVVTLDTNMKQLVQWPVQELESLRGKQTDLRGVELKTGDLVEVKGLKASEVDVEAEFELPNLKTAEPFDANWILDPAMLCRDKGSSVQGKIGPFGLFVLASSDLKEYTAISFRIFDSGEGYKTELSTTHERGAVFVLAWYEVRTGGVVGHDRKSGLGRKSEMISRGSKQVRISQYKQRACPRE